MKGRFWASRTAPASEAASAPFCASRCWPQAWPPSTTRATMATIASNPIATMTRTWPPSLRSAERRVSTNFFLPAQAPLTTEPDLLNRPDAGTSSSQPTVGAAPNTAPCAVPAERWGDPGYFRQPLNANDRTFAGRCASVSGRRRPVTRQGTPRVPETRRHRLRDPSRRPPWPYRWRRGRCP